VNLPIQLSFTEVILQPLPVDPGHWAFGPDVVIPAAQAALQLIYEATETETGGSDVSSMEEESDTNSTSLVTESEPDDDDAPNSGTRAGRAVRELFNFCIC
jgi:hypothetical protein